MGFCVVTDAVVAGVVVVGVVVEPGVCVDVATEGVVSTVSVEAAVVPVAEFPQATVKRSTTRSARSRKSDVFFISNLSLVWNLLHQMTKLESFTCSVSCIVFFVKSDLKKAYRMRLAHAVCGFIDTYASKTENS